ncbi:unnamed protein product [Ilex paraguariensis]|uniref:Uncharacterized protein n=1 Tax=Ilex paraguariensis TaxID=185542 RepID=A0ABC8U2J3_9AQUA
MATISYCLVITILILSHNPFFHVFYLYLKEGKFCGKFLVVLPAISDPFRGKRKEAAMEIDQETHNKDLKVEIPSEAEITSPTSGAVGSGLARQGSIAKNNCLCSPTTHAGSFRCRLHRTPTLHRTKSIDSTTVRGTHSKANASTGTSHGSTVEAQ